MVLEATMTLKLGTYNKIQFVHITSILPRITIFPGKWYKKGKTGRIETQ